jgi:hypothetical protein
MSEGITHRLARFFCEDCGRDWKQYTHEEKEVPCISCGSSKIEERSLEEVSRMSKNETERNDSTGWDDEFEEHRVMDVKVTSNAADGATIDVNGTQLFIKQNNRHVPVLAEIWVENESVPLGSINTARRESVSLGGVDEALAERVDEIRDLPVDEIPAALEKLAYRLNPAGRELPDSMAQDPRDDGWEAIDNSEEVDDE